MFQIGCPAANSGAFIRKESLRMKKYHYLIVFLAGFLVLYPFMIHKLYIEHKNNKAVSAELAAGEAGPRQASLSVTKENISEENGGEETAQGETESGGEAGTVSGQESVEAAKETKPEEEIETAEEAQEKEEPKAESTEEFFQDTLFIGDSRTMGLAEYAQLGNAAVFANTGMNVYRLYSLKNAAHGQETYLEDILAEKQYRRIYFMLGINELGYDFDKTVERYEEEVLKLKEAQPEAEIVLEANLHVTVERSERDEIFNNENINRINESIRQIAEKNGFSYIDVNEIFDDEEGGLNAGYTYDEVHVLGKYYQEWAEWIRNL